MMYFEILTNRLLNNFNELLGFVDVEETFPDNEEFKTALLELQVSYTEDTENFEESVKNFLDIFSFLKTQDEELCRMWMSHLIYFSESVKEEKNFTTADSIRVFWHSTNPGEIYRLYRPVNKSLLQDFYYTARPSLHSTCVVMYIITDIFLHRIIPATVKQEESLNFAAGTAHDFFQSQEVRN